MAIVIPRRKAITLEELMRETLTALAVELEAVKQAITEKSICTHCGKTLPFLPPTEAAKLSARLNRLVQSVTSMSKEYREHLRAMSEASTTMSEDELVSRLVRNDALLERILTSAGFLGIEEQRLLIASKYHDEIVSQKNALTIESSFEKKHSRENNDAEESLQNNESAPTDSFSGSTFKRSLQNSQGGGGEFPEKKVLEEKKMGPGGGPPQPQTRFETKAMYSVIPSDSLPAGPPPDISHGRTWAERHKNGKR